jgi:hypothetical protein
MDVPGGFRSVELADALRRIATNASNLISECLDLLMFEIC